MVDTMQEMADHQCLFSTAQGQHGLFTSAQARACGFRTNLVAYHTRTGRFIRVHHGVYRLRDYPSSPREEVVAAWLALGKDDSVVSHSSALDLLDLSDIIPDAVHLSVPRSRRHFPRLPNVTIHTTTRPFGPADIVEREGVRLTSAARTIVDAAEAGIGPEQILLASEQAVRRGLTTRQRLGREADRRGGRVRRLVQKALARATPR